MFYVQRINMNNERQATLLIANTLTWNQLCKIVWHNIYNMYIRQDYHVHVIYWRVINCKATVSVAAPSLLVLYMLVLYMLVLYMLVLYLLVLYMLVLYM